MRALTEAVASQDLIAIRDHLQEIIETLNPIAAPNPSSCALVLAMWDGIITAVPQIGEDASRIASCMLQDATQILAAA